MGCKRKCTVMQIEKLLLPVKWKPKSDCICFLLTTKILNEDYIFPINVCRHSRHCILIENMQAFKTFHSYRKYAGIQDIAFLSKICRHSRHCILIENMQAFKTLHSYRKYAGIQDIAFLSKICRHSRHFIRIENTNHLELNFQDCLITEF